MLKIKWTDRLTDDGVFQRLLLTILKNRRHSWIGHKIRHYEFVINKSEVTVSGKRPWETSTTVLEASRQKHRS
jgi:hypothetical protein